MISQVKYYFRINETKLMDKKKFIRQVNLACIRIKEKTKYTGLFSISTGYNNNDLVDGKITVIIKKDRIK